MKQKTPISVEASTGATIRTAEAARVLNSSMRFQAVDLKRRFDVHEYIHPNELPPGTNYINVDQLTFEQPTVQVFPQPQSTPDWASWAGVAVGVIGLFMATKR